MKKNPTLATLFLFPEKSSAFSGTGSKTPPLGEHLLFLEVVSTALPANAAAPEVTACHGILCCAAAFPVLTHEPAHRQIMYSSCHVTAPCAKYKVTSFPHWPQGGPEPLTHWHFVVFALWLHKLSVQCRGLTPGQHDVKNWQQNNEMSLISSGGEKFLDTSCDCDVLETRSQVSKASLLHCSHQR